MRALARFATPFVLLLPLLACTPRQPAAPAPAPAVSPTPPAPAAPAVQGLTEAETVAALNLLINDTAPGSDEDAARREALAKAFAARAVPDSLRWTVNQVLAFDPPRLRQRWQEHQQAEESAAEQYAANPPVNFSALSGARVVRRLGPALYLLRLPNGETVLLAASRRLKNGARLRRLLAVETERPKPDRSKGDLVDELTDQPRMFTEISAKEAKHRVAERAPALARLRDLERQGGEMTRAVAADLARQDTLTREVNAVISPRLLPQGPHPAPTAFVRKVRRVAKSYSRQQYYRYALPVTGKRQVDAVLKGHLDERKAEVQALLRSTGVGRGRVRANTDRIAFTGFTASPRLLSIRFEELRDTGGAHPNTTYASFVFDMNSQKHLPLSDLFTDETAALKVLSELASRRMTLALDGAVFPEGVAPKSANFSVFVLDGADLLFTFPPYQVASYAQGAQTLRVPLCHPRLLPLLSPALLEALAARHP